MPRDLGRRSVSGTECELQGEDGVAEGWLHLRECCCGQELRERRQREGQHTRRRGLI